MSELSDETLMAYADGELPAHERADVERSLAADPLLRERLEVFVQTRSALGEMARVMIEEPGKSGIAAMVLGHPAGAAGTGSVEQSASSWGRIAETLRGVLTGGSWGAGLAVACGLVVVVGAGWLAFTPGGPEPTLASGILRKALESQVSSPKVAAPGAEGSVEIRVTFPGANGHCRMYDLTLPDRGSFQGVACRRRDGEWVVEAQAARKVATSRSLSGRIDAAGAVESIAERVEQLRRGAELDADQVEALIARGWRR